jgi:two-component system sensor histidine kinase PhoQ
VQLADDLQLRADQGDLFELFGNLLENAYKHCTAEVRVSAQRAPGRLEILIEDDGPGIAQQDVQRILQRGQRADQRHPGEGIGLAVVSEIVRQYGGDLAIARSALGGAAIRVGLPL